jgi:hypothetical protein
MANMTAQEQLMLELINRARMDPTGEAARYGIALNEGLAAGTISGTPKQVLAGSDTLAVATGNHSMWMLANNNMAHNETAGTTNFTGVTPDSRMIAAGYSPINWWGENIAAAGRSEAMTDALATQLITEQHQSLFVDTFASNRGHRLNILSENFQEVGIGQALGAFQFSNGTFNSSLVTQDFGKSGSSIFITGVVYNDMVANDDFFSVGEQVAGRNISAAGATTDQTGAGGGYELRFAAGGAKSVAFDLAGGTVTVGLTLGTTNIKLDVVNGNEVWSTTAITSVSSNVAEVHALGIGNIDLVGAAGAQKLYGNSGNNVLDGGGGDDIAVYRGAFADFQITQNANGSYTVQDLTGKEGTDTVFNIESLQFSDRLHIFAGPANEAPNAVDDTATMEEDEVALIDVTSNDSDPDGDTFSISRLVSSSNNASVSIVNGKIQVDYTGGDIAPGTTGQVDVVYEIKDAGGKTDTATLTVTVTDSDGASNTAPIANDDVADLDSGVTTALINVKANDSDPDGDNFSVSRIVSVSANAEAEIENGKIRVDYTGSPLGSGETGRIDVVYEVADENGGTDTATLTVNLTGSDARGEDIIGSPKGDELNGTDLGEYIGGRKGRDNIFGNGGDDVIDGGRGPDEILGGSGADIFIFNSRSGHDNLNDFSRGEDDKIDLSGVDEISSYRDLIRHHISFDAFEGVLISANKRSNLWVEDMDGRDMDKADFIF